MMKMESRVISFSGGSDPRARQREYIVPVLPGSGLYAISCDGLLVSCTAGDTSELATAGLVDVCSAGTSTRNASAMGLVYGGAPTLPGRNETKPENRDPLRLRGGGKDGDSSDEGSSSQVSVADGQLVVDGNPLRDISVQPVVMLEDINPMESSTKEREGREKNRDRECKGQRVIRKAHKANLVARGFTSDSEEGVSSAHDRARSLERGASEKYDDRTRTHSLDRNDKRGRPPTTGDYVGLREEQERLNKELEIELKLRQEERIANLGDKELIRLNGKVDMEEATLEAEHLPIADLVSRIREAQLEVLRVSKSSGNLKGTHAGSLNSSAGFSLAYLEALRTKIDAAHSSGTITKREEAQRKEQESFKQNMEAKLKEMEEALRQALQTVEAERQKADLHLDLLITTTKEKEELLRELIQKKEEERRWWGNEEFTTREQLQHQQQPMEVVDDEPTINPTAVLMDEEEEEYTPPPTRIVRATEEEMRAFPAYRPAVQGKIAVLEDRQINISEEINERGEHADAWIVKTVNAIASANKKSYQQKLAEGKTQRDTPRKVDLPKNKKDKKKSKKGNEIKPNWGNMEVYSGQSAETPTRRLEEANRLMWEQLCGGEKCSPPPPIKKERVQQQPSSNFTAKVPPPHKAGTTEARKRRKKERRREKRREEARLRHVAQAPPPPPPMGNMAERAGPKTRSMTGAGPPIPVPPPSTSSPAAPQQGTTQWSQVVGRREKKEKRRQAGLSPATAAFIAAGTPANRGQAATGRQAKTTSANPAKLKKPPRTAAVQIACPENKMADTIRLGRESTRRNLESTI